MANIEQMKDNAINGAKSNSMSCRTRSQTTQKLIGTELKLLHRNFS